MSARIGAGKRARPRRRIDVENKFHAERTPLHSVLRGRQCDARHLLSMPGRGMSLKGKFRCVGLTDTGKIREHNEDTIAFDADIGLLVLADGMGGYNAGEVASGIAVKTILNLVRESVDRQDLRALDRESGMSRPSIILRDAIHRANKIIYQ